MGNKDLEKKSLKVRDTNLATMYFLSLSDVPCAKELFDFLSSKNEIEKPKTTTSAAYMEARYKAIDSLINRNGISQVVEFAAGYTPRGMNHPEWNYVHTDQDFETLERMRIASGFVLSEAKIKFLRVDAITGEGLEEILNYLEDRPVAVVHSGLATYYSHETKMKIAENAGKILEKFGGIYITPDIMTEEYVKKYLIKLRPDYDEAIKLRSKNAGRDLRALFFQTYSEAFELYSSLGFNIERFELNNFVKDLTSVKFLSDNPKR